MRSIAVLCLLVPMIAPSLAARANDLDVELLERKLSKELRERTHAVVVAAAAARIERRVERILASPAPPARVDAGVAADRAALAAPAVADAEARPSRMSCRASSDHVLECVVVSAPIGTERIARVP